MKVYLDNSATSWPKPLAVADSISNFLTNCGASPGRSGHRFAVQAAREVFETRELIAQLFNAPSSERVIFTPNSTYALNTAINGILKKGDHIITTSIEHNSVIRPLKYLESQGVIEITTISCCPKGYINIEELKSSFRSNTRMVVAIHGSNVSGAVLAISSIGEICKSQGVLFMVDAAQTAGYIPINIQNDNIDILTFTGHKKLYGPTGIGGLCIKDNIPIDALVRGGTGSVSEMSVHPNFYPDRLEAGTPNTIGIVGLKAGIEYIMNKGIDNIRAHQSLLSNSFMRELKMLERVSLYGPDSNEERVPVIAINIQGISPSQLAMTLNNDYGIMVRAGLHCAPDAHKTLGTFPQGTLRFSLGCFTTEDEIAYTLDSLKNIISK